MPVVERTIDIEASAAALFALTQDYYLRAEWDPFLRGLRFQDGATAPAPGVRVWVRAWNGLGMEVEYVTVMPPERVAVRMVSGPFFFSNFAGSWIFQPLDEKRSRVVFKYSFATRWPWLRPALDPAILAVFGRDLRLRVKALKHAAENTDLLRRATQAAHA